MKHKIRQIPALLLAILLLTSTALATSFPDVDESAVYADAAEYLNEIGVMQGDTQGNFNPNQTVTRAQMAAIICRTLGEAENLITDGTRFTDVPASYWANGYIARAAELGIISGYQDGTFKPGNTVTYEQAITMVIRAANGDGEAQEIGGYPDGYITLALNFGLLNRIQGKIGDSLSRANVAILIYNLLQQ